MIPATASLHAGVDAWNNALNGIAVPLKVPPNLAKAHMLYESGGNASALGYTGRGCGLMQIDYGTYQISDGTWYYKGPSSPMGEPIFPAEFNIRVGCADFIAANVAAFPSDIEACVAAYNAGIAAVQAALEAGTDLRTVTTDPLYIAHVVGAYEWFCRTAEEALAGPTPTPLGGGAA
jgi:soluble lytic murein transglycosylase-like protein